MSKENGFNVELFFAALADKTRLRLINLMRDGEVCVCFFAGALDTNNPKISRHLAYLKRAGLVKGRRDGKWMHYSLTPPTNKDAAAIFDATLQMLRDNREMTDDRKQFAAYCCSPSAPVMIQGRATESVA
jgi:ArsR family transcriptional regulator